MALTNRHWTHHELLNVPLKVHVGQVWHHMRDHLEAGVLGLLERLGHCTDRVPAIRVPGDVLVHRLEILKVKKTY